MYDPTAMPTSSLAPAASAMFAERSERVYFMARERVEQFIAGVGAQLGLHAFDHSLGSVHDPAAHYVTTLYFDSPLRDLASACEAGGDNIRLRTREYHDRGALGTRFELGMSWIVPLLPKPGRRGRPPTTVRSTCGAR